MMVLMVILIPLFILFFRPLDDFLLLIFVGFWMENANDVDMMKYLEVVCWNRTNWNKMFQTISNK